MSRNANANSGLVMLSSYELTNKSGKLNNR
jgi:hypothetical protein